jgi:hypothetical protein
VAGLLLADLVALDATTLTFLVISSLAAALIARLRSIVGTFLAAMAIGPHPRPADPDPVAVQLPRHDPVRARRRGAAGALAARGDDGLTRGGLGHVPQAASPPDPGDMP